MSGFRLLVSCMAIVTVAASCNSSTTPSGTTGSSAGSGGTPEVSAVINNLPWSANGSIKATYTPATNSTSTSILTIVGTDSPLSQTLTFAVSPVSAGTPLTAGTYTVDTTPTNATLSVGLSTATYQASATTGSGGVTLSTFNTSTRTAAGTFTFVMSQVNGVGTRTVTSGAFTVTYQ